MLTVQEMWKC